jgi:CubicO group peptidase (beta-lactamase class C family)
MALVDEGLLALDEPVGRLLPELAAPRGEEPREH